jgi:cytochrome c-type biogenesis protein
VSSFAGTVTDGPLLVALPVAALAGLVSFLSPCVLPLVPGYLSFVTGLTGADLADDRAERKGRVLLGASLFVLGFSLVFVSEGALFGTVAGSLQEHQTVIDRVLGGVTVLLGLAFMGFIPGMQREVRIHTLPRAGLVGAPLLGILFGVGWTPCIGPTLGAVLTLAYDQGTAARGALLTAGYCLGLGVPFLLVAFGFQRSLGAMSAVKRHYAAVMRLGGGLLVVIGLLLVSGVWERLMVHLRVVVSGYTPSV